MYIVQKFNDFKAGHIKIKNMKNQFITMIYNGPID